MRNGWHQSKQTVAREKSSPNTIALSRAPTGSGEVTSKGEQNLEGCA